MGIRRAAIACAAPRYFLQIEAAHLDKPDSAGECLRAVAYEFWRCAAQHQKLRRRARAVDEHAQHRK